MDSCTYTRRTDDAESLSCFIPFSFGDCFLLKHSRPNATDAPLHHITALFPVDLFNTLFVYEPECVSEADEISKKKIRTIRFGPAPGGYSAFRIFPELGWRHVRTLLFYLQYLSQTLLFRIFNCSCFPDYRYFNMTRIIQFFFNSFSNFACNSH